MLNLNEVVDVKPKLKATIIGHLADAQKMAVSVGEAYNLLANYSLNMQPETTGFYDWFSYSRPGDVRSPWHQRVTLAEAQDIHANVKKLLSIAKQAIPFNIDVQAVIIDIDATIDLLTPAEKHQDGLPIFFSNLWEKQKQTLTDDDLNKNPLPTSNDLKMVTEGPVKMKQSQLLLKIQQMM